MVELPPAAARGKVIAPRAARDRDDGRVGVGRTLAAATIAWVAGTVAVVALDAPVAAAVLLGSVPWLVALAALAPALDSVPAFARDVLAAAALAVGITAGAAASPPGPALRIAAISVGVATVVAVVHAGARVLARTPLAGAGVPRCAVRAARAALRAAAPGVLGPLGGRRRRGRPDGRVLRHHARRGRGDAPCRRPRRLPEHPRRR